MKASLPLNVLAGHHPKIFIGICIVYFAEKILTKDPKPSDRWRTAYLCKTSVRKRRPIYKETVLQACDERNDEWAAQVRVRLSDTRATHDLHAADARYHEDCRKRFTNERNVEAAKKSKIKEVDAALVLLLRMVTSNKDKMWTTVDLQEQYVKDGGVLLSRR